MTPDIDIFFEGRNGKRHVVLLNVSDITAPLKEGLVLLDLDLMRRHGPVPGWTSRDRQWHIVAHDLALLVPKEHIDHGNRVLRVVSTTLHDMRVGEYDLSGAFRLKILGAKLRKRDKLIQGVLLQHRY